MLVLVSAGSTQAGSIQVAGKLGYLSEWEISAEVTPDARKKEFSGPLTIRHTGVCTPGTDHRNVGRNPIPDHGLGEVADESDFAD
jgi:hypothetical protein